MIAERGEGGVHRYIANSRNVYPTSNNARKLQQPQKQSKHRLSISRGARPPRGRATTELSTTKLLLKPFTLQANQLQRAAYHPIQPRSDQNFAHIHNDDNSPNARRRAIFADRKLDQITRLKNSPFPTYNIFMIYKYMYNVLASRLWRYRRAHVEREVDPSQVYRMSASRLSCAHSFSSPLPLCYKYYVHTYTATHTRPGQHLNSHSRRGKSLVAPYTYI